MAPPEKVDERRNSTPRERAEWLRRQAPWINRAMNTTLVTAAGTFSGFIIGGLAVGSLAPIAVAQSPIKLAEGGLETILWALGTALMGLLVYLLKAWVDSTSAKVAAQEIAITELRVQLARLQGQHSPLKE